MRQKLVFSKLLLSAENVFWIYQCRVKFEYKTTSNPIHALWQIFEMFYEYNTNAHHLLIDFMAYVIAGMWWKCVERWKVFRIPQKIINATKVILKYIKTQKKKIENFGTQNVWAKHVQCLKELSYGRLMGQKCKTDNDLNRCHDDCNWSCEFIRDSTPSWPVSIYRHFEEAYSHCQHLQFESVQHEIICSITRLSIPEALILHQHRCKKLHFHRTIIAG